MIVTSIPDLKNLNKLIHIATIYNIFMHLYRYGLGLGRMCYRRA